ncbi:unnamed protein product [Owenia fusiformis]|uniref:Uncharacterized protein n=1 Tax=Owenia fusiformis TaxID=6347 RepID=A0A8J1XTC8_OWEFU|nr:unnamed protein product [Owenia fusiformis]
MSMGLLFGSVVVLALAVFAIFASSWLQPKLPPVWEGDTEADWKPLADIFRKNVESGLEKGGAFAVYYKGQQVVNLRGGYADVEAEIPWNKNTITQVMSTTKAIASITIALLVDRGLLEYDEPIAKYWKEFAQNGKEKITLRTYLSHQAGLITVDVPFSQKLLKSNWQEAGRILARQKPVWEPGTRHGYHMFTIGLYLDQLVRRVDSKQRSLSQYFQEEIAKPFGIDFFIGLPLEENHRCARMYKRELSQIFTQSWESWKMFYTIMKSLGTNYAKASEPFFETMPMIDNPSLGNNPDLRSFINAAAYGFSNAASVAKLFSIVAHGNDQTTNKTLVSKATVESMTKPLVGGSDAVIGLNFTYATGYVVYDSPQGTKIVGHPGWGGQFGLMDVKKDLAWSYTTNHISNCMVDAHYTKLVEAMYAVVDTLERT